MSYLEQAQNAWANAREAEGKLHRRNLTPGQREFAESFVPRAKQDAATLAQLAQAEALVRIADSLDALAVQKLEADVRDVFSILFAHNKKLGYEGQYDQERTVKSSSALENEDE